MEKKILKTEVNKTFINQHITNKFCDYLVVNLINLMYNFTIDFLSFITLLTPDLILLK